MNLILLAQTPWLLVLYSVLHGSFDAFDRVSTNVMWPNYFGRKYLGSIRGVSTTAMVIGSSLGPLPFGAFFDLFGSFFEIILLMMIFPLVAGIACFLSPPPKKEVT
ncbi:hypothetical protein [Natranaerobius trueperi]|uniref:hypothetical protein n=1 Tax=Natranaerobius trueperi TaxID=759412 RepID=UPI00197C9B78|nr:hypothetical protein [Natranaerobius trueperi]